MAIELEIPDGDPWYLSPNLWTVPGNDPEGPVGMPIAGRPCYVWARVTNRGRTSVTNATVRFYWANPAVGFDRTTATPIGISYVTLPAGETGDVLCLSPWVPEFVNDGHECILGEAFHPSLDPLPASNAFNVPTDRHVAQRNISIALAITGMFQVSFEAHNPGRKARRFRIVARQDKLARIGPLQPHFGSKFKLPDREGKIGRLGFVDTPCPGDDALKDAVDAVDDVEIGPGRRVGFTLIGEVEGGAALVHVEQLADDVAVGGLSVLVLEKEDTGKYRGGKTS